MLKAVQSNETPSFFVQFLDCLHVRDSPFMLRLSGRGMHFLQLLTPVVSSHAGASRGYCCEGLEMTLFATEQPQELEGHILPFDFTALRAHTLIMNFRFYASTS